MSDMDDEDDNLDDFFKDDDDDVKPIDMQDHVGIRAKPKEEKEKPENSAPDPIPETEEKPDVTPETKADIPPDAGLTDPAQEQNEKGQESLDDPNKMIEDQIVKQMQSEEAQYDDVEVSDRNYIKKGEYIDLMKQDPTLRDLMIGVGWDQRAFEEAPLDLDLSLFLLNKETTTREDEDFVFYNNMSACDGAVKIMEDSRTGAGEGDDEQAFLDLNGISFDVLRIACIVSIYDDKLVGYNFDMVRNVYLRVVNQQLGTELFCFELEEEDIKNGRAVQVGSLVREGPKWFFDAEAKKIDGGLAVIAKEYGMLIQEDTG